MIMNDNFEQAVEFATKEIEAAINDPILLKAMASINRTIALGVFDKGYDWRQALEKSTTDFEAYEGLQRYCAQLIRKESPLPEDLKIWLAAHLEEINTPPRRSRGAPLTGRKYNMHLPRLVHRICIRFDLKPTRNEASEPVSGCDAVSAAINSIPDARRKIGSKSYDRLAANYKNAKQIGALAG